MEVIDESSLEYLNKVMDKDNITGGWFLTGSPVPVLSILALYLWFVLSLGPRLMASRQPYQLKSIMRLYNLMQVLHNGYMLQGCFNPPVLLWLVLKNSCTITAVSNRCEKDKYIFLLYSWHFFLSKILDLLDTVFLVLRKKDVTILHIYHHTAMVFCMWLTCAYMKTYQSALTAVINMFVHFIMYTYFFLATFPRLKSYLWWKKYLTKLQMLQFVVVLAYFGLLYYFDCPISRAVTYMWSLNVFAILLLFINFYIRTYVAASSSGETSEDKNQKIKSK